MDQRHRGPETSEKYRIPEGSLLILDTAGYYRDLKQIYREVLNEPAIKNDSAALALHKKALKDDTQPVQFRLFDRNGTEIFKMVNCYVDPPTKMDWNVGGSLDAFPPKTDIESLNIHHFSLDLLLKNASLPSGEKLSKDQLPQADHYAVVTWNSFIKRPSKRLIEAAREYVSGSGKSVELLFINNHNAYLWAVMGEEDRERVKADQ